MWHLKSIGKTASKKKKWRSVAIRGENEVKSLSFVFIR